MEVLQIDEAAGFSEVRTANGTQGWMRSQYLVAEPIAKTRLAAAQREVASLRGQRLFQAQRVDELASTAREQADLNSASDSRIAELESELSEIRRISVNAINAHEENLASLETIARLRDEIDDLANDRNRLQDNSENQGILIGAGLLLLGLLVGVIIKARPLRSAWS
jgi:SH3 domain protein